MECGHVHYSAVVVRDEHLIAWCAHCPAQFESTGDPDEWTQIFFETDVPKKSGTQGCADPSA